MRIAEGTIYLVQPVFGYRRLTGAATIGTTWVDYTFAGEAEAAASTPPDDAPAGEDAGAVFPSGRRVLIPITNVMAVVMSPDGENSSVGALP